MVGERWRISVGSMLRLVLVASLALTALRGPVGHVILIATVVVALMGLATLKLAKTRITPARVGIYVAAVLALPFVFATLANQSIWGYPFERPALDARISGVTKVVSVSLLDTKVDGRGAPILVEDPSFSIAQRIDYGRQHEYYSLGERSLIALRDRGLLPDNPPPVAPGDLARLFAVLDATGKLEAGESGYDDAKKLDGVVIEATGADGKPLVFVGVQGGEVSNDHHPYYEFLFEGTARSPKLTLVGFRRFYFDVAGIEGVEWPIFFLGYSILAALVAAPISTLLIVVSRHRSRRTGPIDPQTHEVVDHKS